MEAGNALGTVDLNSLHISAVDKAGAARAGGRSDGLFPCCRALSGPPSGLDEPDKKGKTPLQYAAFMGHEDCIEALVAAGVNINLQNSNGMTPLHFATMSMFGSAINCVQKLADGGADSSIKNVSGKTCLDCVKDPALREAMQGVLGAPGHVFKGRKTKMERELDGDENTSGEEEDEELDSDDSEWDEWDWEWEEQEYTQDAYTHSNKPRQVAEKPSVERSPGPFHGGDKKDKKYGV